MVKTLPPKLLYPGLAPYSHFFFFGSFVINLGQGTDKLNLHFNPRFGESTIVCNSRDGNSWGAEQRENHMCFSPGSEVKVRSKGKGA